MEYTKSEIRKTKERIEKTLKSISETAPYIQIENGIDLMWWGVVRLKLKELHEELAPLKDHIIDNDDYTFANKLNDLIKPVWSDYCTRANNGDFETHKEAYPVQAIITDLRKWIGEYEEEHPKQQDTPTNSPSTKDEGNTKTIINDKILKALPDLYDCLVEDGVINGNAISKLDFGGKVAQGNIPRLRQGESEWIKKTTKFKGFIKCIRHCFNDDWYSAICKSADLTDKEMGKYNTDNTAEFEVTIKAKLQHNGIG